MIHHSQVLNQLKNDWLDLVGAAATIPPRVISRSHHPQAHPLPQGMAEFMRHAATNEMATDQPTWVATERSRDTACNCNSWVRFVMRLQQLTSNAKERCNTVGRHACDEENEMK